MHRLLMALCWLMAGSGSIAQNTDSLPVAIPKNELFVKLSPLAVFETDGGIGFSGEYIIAKAKLGFQLEVQPVFFSIYQNDRDENGWEAPVNTIESGTQRGIKLRPEIRYYWDGIRSRKYHPKTVRMANGKPLHSNETRTYAALDFLYKYTRRERLGDLTIHNGGTLASYRQRAIYTDIKQVTGFDFKIGVVFPVSENRKWFLEVYLGVGFRYKTFSYKDLPVGATQPSRRPLITLGDRERQNNLGLKRNEMSLPGGIKLVYRLK